MSTSTWIIIGIFSVIAIFLVGANLISFLIDRSARNKRLKNEQTRKDLSKKLDNFDTEIPRNTLDENNPVHKEYMDTFSNMRGLLRDGQRSLDKVLSLSQSIDAQFDEVKKSLE